MHPDPAEDIAAAVLGALRRGAEPPRLADLPPVVLRRTLRILAEYDRDILVRIAADAIEGDTAQRAGAEVRRLRPRARR